MARAKTTFSTLYQEPYKSNSNLWGNEITKESSLLAGVKRPAYTMEFIIEKISGQVIKFLHYPSWVINTHAVNYDNCLDIPDINKFFQITKLISGKNYLDTHELVAYWMVKANNFLGKSEELKQLNIPYRISNEKLNSETNNFDHIQDQDVAQAFANMQMESATYATTNTENYHAGLGINNYIHFTSPIRRICDSLIHWCLTYNISFVQLASIHGFDISTMNKLDTSTKKFHQQISMLTKIDDLHLVQNQKIQLDGWIYSSVGNRWTVYFKELGFVRVKMWDFKFSYLLGDSLAEKKIGDKIRCEVSLKPGFLPKEKILIVPLLNLI